MFDTNVDNGNTGKEQLIAYVICVRHKNKFLSNFFQFLGL